MASHARRDAGSWDHATSMLDVARAVASARCLEVLLAILRVPRSVTELAGDLDLDLPRVSEGLGELMGAGLLMYRQSGRAHEYMASPNVRLAFEDGCIVFGFHASCGSSVVLRPTPKELAELVRGDHRAAVPFRPIGVTVPREALDASVEPKIRPAAARGLRGDAPTAPRPASGPGSG
jgi:predicted transcriptional regulator